MESDVDADVPVRMKSLKKTHPIEPKSPLTLPYQPSIIRSQHAISPVSNYSIKSSRDKMDISEIRRILTKLKTEIEHEKKTNQELTDKHNKEFDELRNSLEDQRRREISQLKESWKQKLDESSKKNNTQNVEISRLKQKLSEVTSCEWILLVNCNHSKV